MRDILVRVLLMQVVAGTACVVGFLFFQGFLAAGAAAYGGAIGVLTSLLLAWRMNQAAQPGADLRALYIGAAERMVLAIVGFGVAIALIGLQPLAVVIGFAGTQLAYYAGAGPLKRYVMTTAAEGRRSE